MLQLRPAPKSRTRYVIAEREYAYVKQRINTLDKALDEAITKGWMVADMKSDWRTIFPLGGVRSLQNARPGCF